MAPDRVWSLVAASAVGSGMHRWVLPSRVARLFSIVLCVRLVLPVFGSRDERTRPGWPLHLASFFSSFVCGNSHLIVSHNVDGACCCSRHALWAATAIAHSSRMRHVSKAMTRSIDEDRVVRTREDSPLAASPCRLEAILCILKQYMQSMVEPDGVRHRRVGRATA